MTKAPITVPKKRYDQAVAGVKAGLAILADMEKADAIRLPFPGLPEAIAKMKAAIAG